MNHREYPLGLESEFVVLPGTSMLVCVKAQVPFLARRLIAVHEVADAFDVSVFCIGAYNHFPLSWEKGEHSSVIPIQAKVYAPTETVFSLVAHNRSQTPLTFRASIIGYAVELPPEVRKG